MKLWIKYCLECRNKQAGFALPVAIGMGLIILLVGLTMLLRSQDSQVSAIAQKDTAKSLNAAETGVNEIRALINQHRAIANYPACTTDLNTPPTRNADGTCSDSGSSIESWALPNNIPNILSACDVDRRGEIINLANREWTNVDDDDLSQGEYRLLNYDGSGVAIVQGRVNEGQPSKSVSELKVSFPVSPAPIANLWVATDANTSQVDPEVLVVGPCSSASPIQSSTFTIPAIPAISDPLKLNDLTAALPDEALPRPADIQDNGVYKYQVDTFDSKLTVKAGEKIELRVEGDITLEDTSDNITCIKPDNSFTNCSPLDVKIYGEGTSGTKTITIGEEIRICNVFIHAPDYTVQAGALGSPTVCEPGQRITGIFWVKKWGSSSSSPTLNARPSRPSWNDFLSDYPLQLGPINAWETQERSTS
ncbi:hypothetical protein ON05_018290 [Acaryochloris sp. CCMEE 5410]|nr:hypothetical protein ON05_018290 [Acaryochloris sp. CCMEE 5410]